MNMMGPLISEFLSIHTILSNARNKPSRERRCCLKKSVPQRSHMEAPLQRHNPPLTIPVHGPHFDSHLKPIPTHVLEQDAYPKMPY